jgi:uncharacterized protein YbaP (TraB family)
MKNLTYKHLFLLPLITTLISCGASSTEEKSDEGKPKVKYEFGDDKTLLWEITGNGLKTPSYLYGTIHIQNARVFAYDTVVAQIFNACDAYAMELNMDEMNMTEMMKFMMMEKPIDSFVTPAQFRTIDSLLQKRMKVSLTSQRNYKPFFIYSELMVSSEKKDKAVALDLDFFMKAKKAKKKVIGIEKFEEQFAAVDMISVEEQVKMLLEMTKEDASDSLYNMLVDTYLEGDLEKMIELSADTSMPENFEKAFLIDRNIKMAERIGKISEEQMTFNAVGAAHLGGENGVIALLRKNGYTVKPIKTKFKN